jgi:hypothetical protein
LSASLFQKIGSNAAYKYDQFGPIPELGLLPVLSLCSLGVVLVNLAQLGLKLSGPSA